MNIIATHEEIQPGDMLENGLFEIERCFAFLVNGLSLEMAGDSLHTGDSEATPVIWSVKSISSVSLIDIRECRSVTRSLTPGPLYSRHLSVMYLDVLANK